MKKHKHHIIPKHAGGTDDPSNIVELTVSEHAEEHRKLWEEYGRIEDKVAWNMLSGRKMSEEDRILLAKSGFSKWRADPGAQVAWRNNIILARASQVITEEHKTNIKKGMLQAWSDGKMDHRIMDRVGRGPPTPNIGGLPPPSPAPPLPRPRPRRPRPRPLPLPPPGSRRLRAIC